MFGGGLRLRFYREAWSGLEGKGKSFTTLRLAQGRLRYTEVARRFTEEYLGVKAAGVAGLFIHLGTQGPSTSRKNRARSG